MTSGRKGTVPPPITISSADCGTASGLRACQMAFPYSRCASGGARVGLRECIRERAATIDRGEINLGLDLGRMFGVTGLSTYYRRQDRAAHFRKLGVLVVTAIELAKGSWGRVVRQG